MRSRFSILALSAIAAAAQIQPRRLLDEPMTSMGMGMRPEDNQIKVKTTGRFPVLEVQGVDFRPELNQSVTPGSTLTKIRYGPFKLRAKTIMVNRPSYNMKKPCKSCYVTAVQAGLEYEDGSEANIDNGLWLHHMVMHNAGKMDVNCPFLPQRWIGAGNERQTRRMNFNGKWGYKLDESDSLGNILDLMNESEKEATVYLTMRYEWLPIKEAEEQGYKELTPVWLDVSGGCGLGDKTAHVGKYSYSGKWTSTLDGELIVSTGHMHDGGVDMTISVNGKEVCRSPQAYGVSPTYVERATGMKHISHNGLCEDFGSIKTGDIVTFKANYDAVVHPQMGREPVMGIALTYVGESSAGTTEEKPQEAEAERM